MKKKLNRRSRRRHDRSALRFTPYAWAKLIYLRDLGGTEIGGFAISNSEDMLLVEDIVLVEQHTSLVSVVFVDQSVADYFDAQVDAGRLPASFARIWVHTHPGDSAAPSATDEETFTRVFGTCDWAIMFILARGGQTYCRIQFRAGPGGSLRLPVEIEYGLPFAGTDHEAWEAEYQTHVMPAPRVADRCRLWPRDIPVDPQESGWLDEFDVDGQLLPELSPSST